MPTLNVAGWWDQEDFYGPVRDLRGAREARHEAPELPRRRPVEPRRLVAADRRRARRRFRSAARRPQYFRDEVQAPWFALLPEGQGHAAILPEALTFEAGSNQWRRWDAWPPKTRHRRRGALLRRRTRRWRSTTPGRRRRRHSTATSRIPRIPVPYRQRPIQATYFPGGSKWSTWLVEDQRFVDDRADVLSWETHAARRRT